MRISLVVDEHQGGPLVSGQYTSLAVLTVS
jgi:hypothetical protein